jgi:hypothetical protein
MIRVKETPPLEDPDGRRVAQRIRERFNEMGYDFIEHDYDSASATLTFVSVDEPEPHGDVELREIVSLEIQDYLVFQSEGFPELPEFQSLLATTGPLTFAILESRAEPS